MDVFFHGFSFRKGQVKQMAGRQGSSGEKVSGAVVWEMRGQTESMLLTEYLSQIMVNRG